MQTIYSNFAKSFITLMLATSAVLLAGLAGCGAGVIPDNSPTTNATSIVLTALPVTVKSDGSNTTTITATVLNSSNMVMAGESVSFSSSTGQLIVASAVTDSNGATSANFSAGTSSLTGINRTATITATTGSISKQILVQIVGSTVTASPLTSSVTEDGLNPATVTFKALDAGGTPVANTPITVTRPGVDKVTLTSITTGSSTYTYTNANGDVISGNISGNTDSSGKFVVSVAGVTGGSGVATLTATALGTTASTDITVSTSITLFGISGLSLSSPASAVAVAQSAVATANFSTTSMKIGDSLTVAASAPSITTTSVWFASTLGVWGSASGVVAVSAPVVAGAASAVLFATQAGMADVQVFDSTDINITDSLKVAMTSVVPKYVTLQATPSSVPKNTGVSTLIATVTDDLGQPVGGVPVGFTIVTPTGGGENISPVVAYTATTTSGGLGLGQASTTFTAGSKSTNQLGVSLRATVLGAFTASGVSVATSTLGPGATPPLDFAGNDASIIIGGTPGSVAFGQATVLRENSNGSQYILAMSVIVTDSGGNPAPSGTVVNLSLWPIAWSTGSDCYVDEDGTVWDGNFFTSGFRNLVAGNGGTFYNEDFDENLNLNGAVGAPDSSGRTEDGTRNYYFTGSAAPYYPLAPLTPVPPKTDNHITPANAVAGSIPATVTTGADGVATFELTYPKTSALWVVDRIRGRTVVQGTETVGESQFRLGALVSDMQPNCLLPDSQFLF